MSSRPPKRAVQQCSGVPPAAADPAAIAHANKFQFFTFEETGRIFGFGPDVITKLVLMGAPVVARKINPHLLWEWITTHATEVGKL